jgi:hypothetical protein
MTIESINARVVSQGGHVIAAPRREVEIIPQGLHSPQPVARPRAQQTSRIPAVVAPEMVVVNGQRGMNQAVDDPFMAAILRIAEAGDRPQRFAAQSNTSSNILADKKVQQETSQIELQSLIQRHKFAQTLPDDFPNKDNILKGLAGKIFGNHDDVCPICLSGFDSSALDTARLPCCTGHIHTSCFSRLLTSGGSKTCPLCRHELQ